MDATTDNMEDQSTNGEGIEMFDVVVEYEGSQGQHPQGSSEKVEEEGMEDNILNVVFRGSIP